MCVGSVVALEVAQTRKFLFVLGRRAGRLVLVSREASVVRMMCVCVGSVVASGLAQVSEFLFVLGSRARRLGLVSREASVVRMMCVCGEYGGIRSSTSQQVFICIR